MLTLAHPNHYPLNRESLGAEFVNNVKLLIGRDQQPDRNEPRLRGPQDWGTRLLAWAVSHEVQAGRPLERMMTAFHAGNLMISADVIAAKTDSLRGEPPRQTTNAVVSGQMHVTEGGMLVIGGKHGQPQLGIGFRRESDSGCYRPRSVVRWVQPAGARTGLLYMQALHSSPPSSEALVREDEIGSDQDTRFLRHAVDYLAEAEATAERLLPRWHPDELPYSVQVHVGPADF